MAKKKAIVGPIISLFSEILEKCLLLRTEVDSWTQKVFEYLKISPLVYQDDISRRQNDAQ
jgi:hypothetical protein